MLEKHFAIPPLCSHSNCRHKQFKKITWECIEVLEGINKEKLFIIPLCQNASDEEFKIEGNYMLPINKLLDNY